MSKQIDAIETAKDLTDEIAQRFPRIDSPRGKLFARVVQTVILAQAIDRLAIAIAKADLAREFADGE